MSEGPDLRIAEGADRETVMAMIDFLHTVTQPLRFGGDGLPDPNESGKLMCALAMFAGSICGELIGVGLVPDAQKKKLTDSMARNFRSGIDAGKRKVARVAAQEGIVQ